MTHCGDEVRHGKPAPDCFRAAAAKLGAAPEDCLVIEDAPSGVQARMRHFRPPFMLFLPSTLRCGMEELYALWSLQCLFVVSVPDFTSHLILCDEVDVTGLCTPCRLRQQQACGWWWCRACRTGAPTR